ncbi:MAG: hypothetical protein IPH08_04410 [Rhodocyclaceae bacterium]|nr:hypothetical protein [Rhodocyclaceae bacterium]
MNLSDLVNEYKRAGYDKYRLSGGQLIDEGGQVMMNATPEDIERYKEYQHAQFAAGNEPDPAPAPRAVQRPMATNQLRLADLMRDNSEAGVTFAQPDPYENETRRLSNYGGPQPEAMPAQQDPANVRLSKMMSGGTTGGWSNQNGRRTLTMTGGPRAPAPTAEEMFQKQAMQTLQDPSIPMAQKIQVYQAMNKGQDMDSVLKGLQIKKAERDLNAPIPGEKPPAGYRFTPSGDLVPITGGPADPRNQADKPLTEFQGKSTAFGTRAAVAHGILNSVGNGGKVQPGMIKRSLEAVPWAGEGLGTLSNWTQSPKQQQVDQAQRDFVNAVLRQESGAAIGPDEFANATKQYFPQPGDSPDVIRQKAENRETAIAGFELNAGNRGGAAVRAAGGSVNTVTPPGSPAHKTDWLARAKAKNPGMSGAALEAEYLKKFRG